VGRPLKANHLALFGDRWLRFVGPALEEYLADRDGRPSTCIAAQPAAHWWDSPGQVVKGLRSAEVLGLRVRDLDNGGKDLWGDVTKTRNARRALEIKSELLRSRLLMKGERESTRRCSSRAGFVLTLHVSGLCSSLLRT